MGKFTNALFAAGLAVMVFMTLEPARAEYPEGPITTVNGAAAGGGLDTYNRLLASVAQKYLDGQPMVVVNMPGAGHMIANRAGKDAPADGYNLTVMSAGSALLATMLQDYQVDILKDYRIISQIGGFSTGLIARRDGKYASVSDLLDAARRAPGTLRYGHSGRGNSTYVAMEAFLEANGVTMQDVPFQGGAQSRGALIAGQVDVISVGIQQLSGFENDLQILGIFNAERDSSNPDAVPFEELGIPSPNIFSPVVVAAPAAIPDDVALYLESRIKEMVKDPKFLKAASEAEVNVDYLDSKAATALLERLQVQWKPIVERISKRK